MQNPKQCQEENEVNREGSSSSAKWIVSPMQEVVLTATIKINCYLDNYIA